MKNSFDEKILEEAHDWVKANQKVVLATVIQTWGSSPRQVGSRMIVNEKGDFSGSVSGGCVESAVVRECIGLIDATTLISALVGVKNVNKDNNERIKGIFFSFFISKIFYWLL